MTRASHKDWHSKEQLEKLQGWARDGLTDDQIASNVGCSRSTLNEWKSRYSDISDALKKGKEVVDVEVENALLKKAMGTTTKTTQYKMVKVDSDVLKAKRVKYMNAYKLDHPDKTKEEIVIAAALAIPTYERIPIVETVQEIPPDTSAIIFWLKNRLPEKYRDQVFRKLNMANAENVKLDQELKRLKIKSIRDNGADVEELVTKLIDNIAKEDKHESK
nr:MAG TPA: terminase small subunit [Caudoviricetes sp.]